MKHTSLIFLSIPLDFPYSFGSISLILKKCNKDYMQKLMYFSCIEFIKSREKCKVCMYVISFELHNLLNFARFIKLFCVITKLKLDLQGTKLKETYSGMIILNWHIQYELQKKNTLNISGKNFIYFQ